MAKDLLSNFPHKLGFGSHGKREDAVQDLSTVPVASGGYRPRKQSAPPLEQKMSMSLINKGLLNPTGENNCFLNSAVQILWHIDVFRRSFRNLKGHTCIEEACIFCALKELFAEFQHGGQSAIPPDILRKAMAECYEEQNRFQLGLMDDAAECFEKLLEQIHLHLTGTEDMESCGVPHCLPHQKFALTILERTECTCGATSEPLSFVQFVHYISSSAIVKETQRFAEKERDRRHRSGKSTTSSSSSSSGVHQDKSSSNSASSATTGRDVSHKDTTSHKSANHVRSSGDRLGHSHPSKTGQSDKSPSHSRGDGTRLSPAPEASGSGGATGEGSVGRPRLYTVSQDHFGKILNKASSMGEFRKCPEDRCKKTVLVKRLLLNCPDVVCLGMIWDSAQPSVEDIMSVVYSIGLKLQLNDVFDHVFSDGANINQYELTALIAYYGRHYSTFCYHSKMHEWIYFDDARFRSVGAEWSDVCEEIRKAHYQPLLLVYTNPFAEAINLSEAPKTITKIHHCDLQKKSSSSSSSTSSASSSQPPSTAPVTTTATTTPSPALPRIGEEQQPLPPPNKEDKKTSTLPSHFIDPMTFSIRPMAQGGTMKSTTPVVDSNRTSATLDSKRSPNKASEAPGIQNGNKDDLMTFSITPAMFGINGQVERNQQKTNPPNIPQPAPSGNQDISLGSGDLIEFSLTPAILNKYKSSAVYNPSSRSRLFEDSKRSPYHSNSNSPFHSPSISPVPSRKSPQPSRMNPPDSALTQFHAGSSMMQKSPSHSPAKLRSGSSMAQKSPAHASDQFRSSTPKSEPQSQKDSSVQDANKINPKWDHFKELNSPPHVHLPPQKLLPNQQPTTNENASSITRHHQASPNLQASGHQQQQHNNSKSTSNRGSKKRSEEDRKIQQDWTLVDQADSNKQDEISALQQLRRIVSQPGFENVNEALIPMGGDFRSSDLTISTVDTSAGDNKVKGQSPAPPSPIPIRSKADPLPSLPPGGGRDKDQGSRHHRHWFPNWETFQNDDKETSKPSSNKTKASRDTSNGKLDYADLDLTEPGYERLNAKFPDLQPSSSGTVDYAEILFQSSDPVRAEAKQVGGDDYSNLADINTDVLKMEKTAAMPLGYDPDYAIPDKVSSRLKQVHKTEKGKVEPNPPLKSASDKQLSSLQSSVEGNSRKTISPHSGNLSDVTKVMSESVRSKYQEGLSVVAVARSSQDTDTTVAMMLLQKAAGLFLEVMQEPSVRSAPVIYDRIKAHREDAIKNSVLLQKKGDHASNSWEKCRRCELKRYLNDNMLCGPCQLREKMAKK